MKPKLIIPTLRVLNRGQAAESEGGDVVVQSRLPNERQSRSRKVVTGRKVVDLELESSMKGISIWSWTPIRRRMLLNERSVVEASDLRMARVDLDGAEGLEGENRELRATADAMTHKIGIRVTKMTVWILLRIEVSRLESVLRCQPGKRRSQFWSSQTSRIIKNRVADGVETVAIVDAAAREVRVETVAIARVDRAETTVETTVALAVMDAATMRGHGVAAEVRTVVGDGGKYFADWIVS